MARPRPRAVCGIATFRQDEAVLERVSRAASARGRELFTHVVIVDSLGSGELPAALARRGCGPFVRYYDFGRNLGAAGNLHHRLLLAAGLGADYLFALNHDGHLDLEAVSRLLRCAQEANLAAAYPLRRVAPDLFDLAGTRPFPLRPRRVPRDRLPGGSLLPAHWSSSNGALYSLGPTWRGVRPQVGLWMGFEDYGWGLALERAGFRQGICLRAELDSGYDYATVAAAGRELTLADKPPWLTYYLARNLLLLGTRYFAHPKLTALAAARIARELLVILALRNQRATRLRLLARGVIDGLRGRTGLVVPPPTRRQSPPPENA